MKFACIFEDQLYSFHYDEFRENEYYRKLNQWTNTEYLYKFAKANNVNNIPLFIDHISENLEEIEELIDEIAETDGQFKRLFIPLDDAENHKHLSLRKGKIINNKLRLYAVKLSEEVYIITGGAIKMSQRMEQHPCTLKELSKLFQARQYLEINDTFNEDAFYELITES